VNFDCDYQCIAEVEVNCKAQCTRPTGGIFCNGQFVNATDVKQCIAYLGTRLNIDVDVSATGSAACTGDGCGAEGKGSVKGGGCAAAPGSGNGVAAAFGLFGVLGLAAWIRARRRGVRSW
jgi:MYXO-CTERM domain-containing protein